MSSSSIQRTAGQDHMIVDDAFGLVNRHSARETAAPAVAGPA
jgi:hypothetical protein